MNPDRQEINLFRKLDTHHVFSQRLSAFLTGAQTELKKLLRPQAKLCSGTNTLENDSPAEIFCLNLIKDVSRNRTSVCSCKHSEKRNSFYIA